MLQLTTITRQQIRRQAENVFGSREAAAAWLAAPAMALDQRRPEEFLETAAGRQLLANLLTQLEFGVYV